MVGAYVQCVKVKSPSFGGVALCLWLVIFLLGLVLSRPLTKPTNLNL